MGKDYKNGNYAPKNLSTGKQQAKPFVLVNEGLGQGKHIAGTYFEMALANMLRTIEYVFVRANVSSMVGKLQDDTMADAIERLAHHNLSATQKSTLSRLIFRHMPFFGPLMSDAVDNALYPLRKELKELEDRRDEINEELQDKCCNNRQELEAEKETLKKKIKASRKALEQQIVGSSPQLIIEYLSVMARMMVVLRNTYSHKNPYSNPDDIIKQKSDSQKLALWLEIIFNGERGILLERKTHSQEDTMFLTQDGILNYNVNKNKKSTRNNNFYFRSGKKTDKGWELTDFGRYFFCSLFLRKVDADRFAKDVCLYILSPFQLSAENRLQLQEKENLRARKEQLIADANGEDRIVNPRIIGETESCQNNIIREMLDMHRIHIPREKRIDADITEGILVMDALNELRKCPKIIHDTFCPDDKENFVTKGVTPNGEILENKLIRPHDRFVNLALRCIDQNKVFTDIRFHLRLGLFRFRFYPKETIDGSSVEPVRTVQKEINCFGRWNEVEEMRNNKYRSSFQIRVINDNGLEQPVPDSTDTKPYITDWRTTYNIHANRIGLAWGLSQMTEGYYLPDLEIDKGDNRNRKATVDMPSPMCYLSTYDLPALLFYNHIYNLYHGSKYSKKGIVDAENIIKKKYEALHDFFIAASSCELSVEKLLEKQKELEIADDELPDKLRCFLGTKKLFSKIGKPILKKTDSGEKVVIMKGWRAADEKKRHALNTLQEVIEEDVFRLEQFDKKHSKIIKGGRDNRYGRRGHADVRHGAIARYLAKSMLRWQPAISKVEGGKITSPNFRVLSDYLASYGIGVKEEFANVALNNLKNVLREAALIDSQNSHPFLMEKVLNSNPKNIEQLYTTYLQAEKAYAEDLTAKINKGDRDIDLPPFARSSGLRWETTLYEAASRYIEIPTAPFDETTSTHNAPIMLPDGLFTAHIINLLRIASADTSIPEHRTLAPMRELLESDPNTLGASHIIRYWFDHVAHDRPQTFYNNGGQQYKRFHRALSLLNPQRKRNKQLIPDYFTEDEIVERLKYARNKNKGALKDKVIKAYNLDSNKTGIIDEKLRQMRDMINEVSAKEQCIRRYRVQDITLFLTVRDMLIKMLSSKSNEDKKENIRKQTLERINKMRLQEFGFGFDFKLFAATDEDSSYTYEHKSGIKIKMPSLSLNNYGSIFRVLSEGQRVDTLLSGLKELGITEVNFSDLTAEMAEHDEKRKEFLRIAQDIEQKAYEQNYDVLSNDRSPDFYKNDIIYDVDNPEKILNPSTDAKRNHFPDLVKLLKEYTSFISVKYKDENGEEKKISLSEFVRELRNAAAHNRYPKTYVFKELKERTISKTISVQNIIDMILDLVKQDIEELNMEQ